MSSLETNVIPSSRRMATVVVAVVGIQRVGELVWSKRNERRLVERGAVEYGKAHYR